MRDPSDTRPRARTRVARVALVALLGAALPACTSAREPAREDRQVVVVSPPDPDAPRHTHETTIGDGTTAEAGGYRMAALSFPATTDQPGMLTFRILGPDGRPVLDFTEEQTKPLHLYVVRDDLAVFRHVHPSLHEDGTWSAYVDVREPGRYRVVAEFVPSQRPGGSHVVVAGRAILSGASRSAAGEPTPYDDPVTLEAPASVPVGADEELSLVVSDGAGGALNLGTYLGAHAHLTGFEESRGAFVHVHPLGAPTITVEGSELRFHTSFAEAGTYRFFVQVRVDGFVHTVPFTLAVA